MIFRPLPSLALAVKEEGGLAHLPVLLAGQERGRPHKFPKTPKKKKNNNNDNSNSNTNNNSTNRRNIYDSINSNGNNRGNDNSNKNSI